MALGGVVMLASRGRVTNLRALSALNWIALVVHQYEEYEDPGYFPGQFNRGTFKSDHPHNYPLNTHNAMCIDTAIAYPFYALPVAFPKVKWLGIAPVVFGMAQAVSEHRYTTRNLRTYNSCRFSFPMSCSQTGCRPDVVI